MNGLSLKIRENTKEKIKHADWLICFDTKPVPDSKQETGGFSKLSRLRPRRLIKGDPDELINLKVGEWNEPFR